MSRLPHNGRRMATSLLAALTALLWISCGTAKVSAAGPHRDTDLRQAGASYQRADAASIRDLTDRIVSDRRFAKRGNPWAWVSEKIVELLGLLDRVRGAGKFVLLIVTIWCVLTLLAIAAHFGWTIYMLIRGARSRKGRGAQVRRHEEFEGMSYSDLCVKMRQLAHQGRYREAIGVMMVALLRWLDRASVVGFHRSKANGDYMREYPRAAVGRDDFRQFINAFDGTVYGGTPCEEALYRKMELMFERVRSHVGKE